MNSPHRETPKNVIKKIEKKSVLDFWSNFCKNFSTRFFLQNVFCGVFEVPLLKNTRKCDKTKKVEEKLTSKFFSKFWGKFSTWSFCKNILWCFCFFELPLPRNAQKRAIKKSQEKKSRMVGRWVWDLANVKCTGGSVGFFLAAPRVFWQSGFRLFRWALRPQAPTERMSLSH